MQELSDARAYELTRLSTWRVGDLFAGVGGWSTGFKMSNYRENIPFKTLWAVDNWEKAAAVHKVNHPSVEVVVEDIRDLDLGSLEPVDVIVGSPPCPNFSSAKQAQERDIDAGLELVNAFFHVVNYMKPKFWAMENVKTFKRFIPFVKNIPRPAVAFIMKGTDYGLPQRRERCIVTNLVQEPKQIPTNLNLGDVADSLHRPGDEPPVRIFDPLYFNDELIYPPTMEMGMNVDRHDLYEVKPEHIEKLHKKKMLNPNAGKVPFPDPLERAARTIIAQPSPIGRETIVIEDTRYDPPKTRYLSLREQAILQGFPVGYRFVDKSKVATQKMIGNAFPPPMARSIANRIWVEMV